MTASAPRGASVTWRRLPAIARVVVVVLLAVLTVELVASLSASVVGERTVAQSPTSPYETGPEGTSALVTLLSVVSPTVTVRTAPLLPGSLAHGTTLLVVDPLRWTALDRATVAALVDTGGHVVFVGAAPRDVGVVLPGGATVTRDAHPAGPVVLVARGPLGTGITSLVTGTGTLVTTGAVRADVVGRLGTFAASSGPVTWVASSAPLRNGSLSVRDDAALAWNLVRPFGRPVVIDTADMTPPAQVAGLRALPSWWQAGILLVVLAMATWVLSASRRFGPALATDRALAPARIGHVDAVAAVLADLPGRHVGEATAPVAGAAHRALLARVHRTEHDGEAGIDKDAADRGIPPWVVRAATTVPTTRREAVESGRALAWLRGEEAPAR